MTRGKTDYRSRKDKRNTHRENAREGGREGGVKEDVGVREKKLDDRAWERKK